MRHLDILLPFMALGLAACFLPQGPADETADGSSASSSGAGVEDESSGAGDETSRGEETTRTAEDTGLATTSGSTTAALGSTGTGSETTGGDSTTFSGDDTTSSSSTTLAEESSGGEETTAEEETCPLPERFRWVSTGPLAQPKNRGAFSLKDFSVARDGDRYVVYGTTADGSWNGFVSSFESFDAWAEAEQHYIRGLVAPTIFYFTPKNVWVLAYQWGFKYATSTTPRDPASWSPTASLMSYDPDPTGGRGTGPIDQTIICDDRDCYLFFNDDAGGVYRASMPIDDFPGEFRNAERIMNDPSVIFEGIQVYSIKGSDKYLMIIENNGVRAFRAWTADSLGGTWTRLAGADTTESPFAGEANVTWPDGKWTRDISHGDLVRENPSEKMEIDPCNLQMLYQGRDPNVSVPYGELPYRPGLLTLQR